MIQTVGRFVHHRYRGSRVSPVEWVDPEERDSMFVRHPIQVADARTGAAPPELSVHGFALARHPTRVDDLHDPAQIPTLFEESRQLVSLLTGCVACKVLNYQYRNSPAGTWPEGRILRAPMVRHEPLFHTDVTPYAEFPLDGAADGRHFRIFTLWRNCDREHPVRTMPLAVCDLRSVVPQDVVLADSLDGRDPPRVGHSYRLVHRPTQRWHYFPAMTVDEVLVHKQYDTLEEAAHRRGVFHGAVVDPTVGPDARPRLTVEVRLMALFEEETAKLARIRRFHAELPPATPAPTTRRSGRRAS